MTILIVRHGETRWNREMRMMGIRDLPLTKKGLTQAGEIASYLKNYPIDLIFTSPLKRTLQTARAIKKHHRSVAILTRGALRERSFGALEGKTYEEINTLYPQLIFHATWNYPHFKPPGGGERLTDVQERARAFLHSLITRYEGKTVVIVSHGTFLRVLMSTILHVPMSEFSRYRMDNASLSIVQYSSIYGASIQLINYTGHLSSFALPKALHFRSEIRLHIGIFGIL